MWIRTRICFSSTQKVYNSCSISKMITYGRRGQSGYRVLCPAFTWGSKLFCLLKQKIIMVPYQRGCRHQRRADRHPPAHQLYTWCSPAGCCSPAKQVPMINTNNMGSLNGIMSFAIQSRCVPHKHVFFTRRMDEKCRKGRNV